MGFEWRLGISIIVDGSPKMGCGASNVDSGSGHVEKPFFRQLIVGEAP